VSAEDATPSKVAEEGSESGPNREGGENVPLKARRLLESREDNRCLGERSERFRRNDRGV